MANVKPSKALNRRDVLKLFQAALIEASLVSVGGMTYRLVSAPSDFRVEILRLTLPRLTPAFDGLRIAQLSDVHIGGWMDAERLQEVIELVKAQNPHLVVITGDFLIGHGFNKSSRQAIVDLIDLLTPLAQSLPVYAVLGNHDYWTNVHAVRDMLLTTGIRNLTNTAYTLRSGSEQLHIAGVDDVWEGHVRLDEVVRKLPTEGAAILLAHEPDFAERSAQTGRFDLQLSGHSHGGQIVLPGFGAPILPFLAKKFPSGLYQVGNMLQYTNRGIGMARLPIRLNCPPEITIFELKART